MSRIAQVSIAVLVLGLSGCGPDYSPNTYSTAAVQQANKVEQGVIVGVRQVDITALGAAGTVTGAAAGGIAGSQASEGVGAALTALGGAVVGGIVGGAVDRKINDTFGFEYIVRKANAEMVSVTQKDEQPLPLGRHVLVIAGPQARIVPDYTVPLDTDKQPTAPKAEPASVAKPAQPPVAAAPAVAPPPVPDSTPPAPPSAPTAAVAAPPAAVDMPIEIKPLDAPPAAPAKEDSSGAVKPAPAKDEPASSLLSSPVVPAE